MRIYGKGVGVRETLWPFLVLLVIVVLFAGSAAADTVHLNDNVLLKGLVVEDHHDRIVLSTGEGERVIFKQEIHEIEYDDLEYNLLALGRKFEAEKRWREALSYYEEALAVNPALTDAKAAAVGIRNRMWAKQLDEGPIGDMEKRQVMQDAWSAGVDVEELARRDKTTREKELWDRLGLAITKEGEWVSVRKIRFGGPTQKLGLKRGDAFVALDGRSLRYFNAEAVMADLLEPRYSSATLRIQRNVAIQKWSAGATLRQIGLRLDQELDGLTVTHSVAPRNGVKRGDIIVSINGVQTRYMPLRDAVRLIESPGLPKVLFKVNRSLTLTRR